jgi:hypothetical protein
MLRTLIAVALLTTATTASAQWQLQDTHTTADLRGIDNVGNGVAWASGSNGTILHTEDAGFVWQLCAKPPNSEHLDFRAIQAFDNNTAIIMSSGKGDLSRLYKTTDGCQSWTLLFTNPDKDGFWDALVAKNGRAFVLGDPPTPTKTASGTHSVSHPIKTLAESSCPKIVMGFLSAIQSTANSGSLSRRTAARPGRDGRHRTPGQVRIAGGSTPAPWTASRSSPQAMGRSQSSISTISYL